MSAHWLLAAGFVGMAVAIFWLGWASRIMWREWKDDRALRAAEARYERHTHRKSDPQETTLLQLPTAGRLSTVERVEQAMVNRGELSAEPPWLFAGESEQGWAAESAEYELLTQTAEQPATADEQAERLTDTGEMRALSAAWIAKMQGDSNEWIFTHVIGAEG